MLQAHLLTPCTNDPMAGSITRVYGYSLGVTLRSFTVENAMNWDDIVELRLGSHRGWQGRVLCIEKHRNRATTMITEMPCTHSAHESAPQAHSRQQLRTRIRDAGLLLLELTGRRRWGGCGVHGWYRRLGRSRRVAWQLEAFQQTACEMACPSYGHEFAIPSMPFAQGL